MLVGWDERKEDGSAAASPSVLVVLREELLALSLLCLSSPRLQIHACPTEDPMFQAFAGLGFSWRLGKSLRGHVSLSVVLRTAKDFL